MTRKIFNRLMKPQGDGGGDDGTGGSGPSGGDAIGTGNDARVALLNSIGDSADKGRAEDLADINDDGTTTPFVVQTAEGDTDPLITDPVVPDPVAVPPVAEPTRTAQMITRKVNGHDVTKSLEEWLIDAQKVVSADEYLVEAAGIRKDAIRGTPPQEPKPQATKAPVVDDEAELRAQVRALQMGTEEEAVTALRSLRTTATTALPAEEISRVIDERLMFNTAIADFNKEFSDLVKDPQLHRMVLEADRELVRKGDTRPYAERYTELGTTVRAWRDNLIKQHAPVPAPAPAPVASLDAKRAAKAAAPKPPVAASTTAQTQADDDGEENTSDVIANMAKARGGPGWMRS